MRQLPSIVLALGLCVLPSLANATERSGVLHAIVEQDYTFTLADGTKFQALPGIDLKEFEPGMVVVVDYFWINGEKVAATVDPVKATAPTPHEAPATSGPAE